MTNFAALPTSDGDGESIRATVQSPGREIGSSVIPVNAITNWPTGPCIITTGVLQANNTISSPTVLYGTASGTSITISGYAAGYSDIGNTAGEVVVIKPTTEWANTVAAFVSDLLGTGTAQNLTANQLAVAAAATFAAAVTLEGVTEVTGTSYNLAHSVATADGSGNITPTSQVFRVTALTESAEVQIPSYTPVDGMSGELRISDNGTGQGLTWASGWRAVGVTLPSSTTGYAFTYISYEYSTADSKFHVLGVARG
jgi:hypothetical protein